MIYMSLRENLFPPWSRNCVGQLLKFILMPITIVSVCLSRGSKNL